MMTRRRWQAAAAVAVGILVALGLGEAVVRIAGLAPGVTPLNLTIAGGEFVSSPNPLLKYVPRPGSTTINSYGIREREIAIPKPPDAFRIVVVGDSVAYGYCNGHEAIAPEERFSARVERTLNDARWAGKRPVEVINLAVSGYDTSQEAEFLRQKGLALDPDLVLVSYSLNDAMDASYELAIFRRTAGWTEYDRATYAPTLGARLFQYSHLFRLAWQRLGSLRRAGAQSPGEARVDAGFDQIAAMSRQRGFKVLVAVFPMFEKFSAYPRLNRHRWAKEHAEARGFIVVDLLQPFRDASGDDWTRFRGRCNAEHPDEQGHALAARAIGEYLFGHPQLFLRPGQRP